MLKPMIIALVALGLTVGCKKDEAAKDKPAAKTPTEEPTTATPKPAPKPTEPSEADVQAALAVMVPYETCREKLAADKSDLSECATLMAKAAGSAKDGFAEAAMTQIEGAANALAKAPTGDIDKTRVAFGDVSKPVEAMLTAIPKAAAKYKMFECPMAKGFKRWAQPTGDKIAMANPYMGTKMLECGSEVHDHHMGAKPAGDGKHSDGKHGDGHK